MTSLWKNQLIMLAATGFGLGYSPVAPGTLGTLAALPFIWLFTYIPKAAGAFFLVCFLLSSVFVADRAEKILGRKDPGAIVIDEIAGYWVTMCLVPVTGITLIVGFIAFRCFDIFKIPPVRYFEKNFSGGAGVVLDDIMAGVLAAFTVKCLYVLGVH
ncbi:MAG: phosphatidylglycerophosphatase A [Desulfotignum sp.]|nr:phosphatidylglycerophosphatase A [Desulfotignum sp.]MCF8135748.1 phosphatidylglycerophosphatase A [Desulfotignum sp.]